MKNLFDTAAAEELKARVLRVRPDNERQWGKMNAAQAMAHMADALEITFGERRPPRMMIGRLIGPIVKRLALGNDAPMRRNSPTVPDLAIADARDLAVEQQRLAAHIDRFVHGGRAVCTTHPHSFFGRLTPDEWAVLMYKHVDHHLRQFSA